MRQLKCDSPQPDTKCVAEMTIGQSVRLIIVVFVVVLLHTYRNKVIFLTKLLISSQFGAVRFRLSVT